MARGFFMQTSRGNPAIVHCVNGRISKESFRGSAHCRELIVSESVRLIVNAYVQLKDRQAIEELREHRRMLRQKLQAIAGGGFDPSRSIRLIDSDLSEIDAGLARLQ
jgi:hypothetical protein